MGSIGVSSGRLSAQSVGNLLEGSMTRVGRSTNSIVVFPNSREADFSDARSRYRGFAITMSNATADQREAFLRRLRGRSNTAARNADAAARRAYNDAIRGGQSERNANIAAELARTRAQRTAIQNLLDSDTDNKFGNIRLRNITMGDYRRLR